MDFTYGGGGGLQGVEYGLIFIEDNKKALVVGLATKAFLYVQRDSLS
jgi:hypothetical protein